MRVYTNSSSLHNVSKVEMVDGYGDGVRKIVIHQAVETDRADGGSLIVTHEITVHPVKETTVTPISVTPIAMEVV